MKKTLIGTSWKMNKTLSEASEFCQILEKFVPSLSDNIQPFIIPSFTCVRDVTRMISQSNTRCLTGVQNMHYEDAGAFTGEISPLMVKDTGAYLVEMGHSERREFFGETDLAVNKKVAAALKHGLRPLVCIGDSAQDMAWGTSAETVIKQMKAALSGLSAKQAEQVIVAYEPIWAIGEQGKPATPEQAEYIHVRLRQALVELYGSDSANNISLLYGGSVNPQNAVPLISRPDIDGLFIGRSAWQAEGFCQILKLVEQYQATQK